MSPEQARVVGGDQIQTMSLGVKPGSPSSGPAVCDIYLAAGSPGDPPQPVYSGILLSRDGTKWSDQLGPDIATQIHNGGQIGYGGNMWTNEVAYGKGVVAAAGRIFGTNGGVIMTSTDGIHWTERQPTGIDPLDVFEWTDVQFDGQQFVALGRNRFFRYEIAVSDDGLHWVHHYLLNLSGQQVTSRLIRGDGLWYAYFVNNLAGHVYPQVTTFNAPVIQDRTDPESPENHNSTYQVLGTGGPGAWGTTGVPAGPTSLQQGAFHGGLFIGLAELITNIGGIWYATGAIYTSSDGHNWTRQPSEFDALPPSFGSHLAGDPHRVIWNGKQWLLAGGMPSAQMIVMTSPDGTTWTHSTMPPAWTRGGLFSLTTSATGNVVLVGGALDSPPAPEPDFTIGLSTDGGLTFTEVYRAPEVSSTPPNGLVVAAIGCSGSGAQTAVQDTRVVARTGQ